MDKRKIGKDKVEKNQREKLLKIAICDDDQIIMLVIEKQLREFDIGCPFDIDLYEDGESLMECMCEKEYDLIFLDIEMPNINGFKVAKEIRGGYKQTEIVFVSSYENLVYQSFAFKPFRFLRKSHIADELGEIMDAYVKEYLGTKETVLQVIHSIAGIKEIGIDEICYIESCGHYTTINHVKGVFKSRESLGNLLNKLIPYGFVRIHRGYIVNLAYIKEIYYDKVILKNNRSLPIGRTYRRHVKEALLSFEE